MRGGAGGLPQRTEESRQKVYIGEVATGEGREKDLVRAVGQGLQMKGGGGEKGNINKVSLQVSAGGGGGKGIHSHLPQLLVLVAAPQEKLRKRGRGRRKKKGLGCKQKRNG